MISVIIPVFNRVNFVQRAISSVLEQTVAEFELIVVDDGSTEDLSSVLTEASENGAFVLQTENQGVAAARNRGIEQARGEWITFLDSDDYWLPEKLERQRAYHHQYPKVLVSQCEEQWIRHGRFVNKRRYHQMASGWCFVRSLERCLISPSSVMIHRSVFEEVGQFDERLPVCEDYDLWLRITPRYEIGLVRIPLVVKYGGHPDQLSKSRTAMDRFRLLSLLEVFTGQSLTSSQRLAVRETISHRAAILAQGAQKHASADADLYRTIAASFKEMPTPNEVIGLSAALFRAVYDQERSGALHRASALPRSRAILENDGTKCRCFRGLL